MFDTFRETFTQAFEFARNTAKEELDAVKEDLREEAQAVKEMTKDDIEGFKTQLKYLSGDFQHRFALFLVRSLTGVLKVLKGRFID